jgi:predicted transposase YbfD/YdcC
MTKSKKISQQRAHFIKFFQPLKDPRRIDRGNIKHDLSDMVFLVISAVISGAVDWTHIEIFGNNQINWLRKYAPFKNGIPSHDILGGVFGSIDPNQFAECFINWISSIAKIKEGEVIAIDGKRIRGSYDNYDNKAAIHMVSAFASQNKLCLGQVETADKSNEVTAIPKLLDLITTKGSIVTIDAMGCQKDIAKKIISKKADYILAVKENQKELFEQTTKMFSGIADIHMNETIDTGHGRIETRKCSVVDDLSFFDIKNEWEAIKSVIKIDSNRYIKSTGKSSNETRYYISSLKTDAEEINQAVRSHWSIENNLHWTLDVVFSEDASRKRKKNSAANFTLLTKIAMALLAREETKMSMRAKRYRATVSPEYREKVLKL